MEHVEKKLNLTIVIFFVTMVAKITPSSKKLSSYVSGATGPELMILWPYKKSLKWDQYLSVL